MNPTLYAWCQEPVLGAVLWAMTLCGFPPPLKETPIVVSAPGRALAANFEAPVAKTYLLSASYTFPSTEDRVKDTLVRGDNSKPCLDKPVASSDSVAEAVRTDPGRPLRLKVTIRSLPKGEVVYSQILASECQTGHDGGAKKTQVMGLVALPEGDLSIEVDNLEARQELAALNPALVIHSGGK